MGFGVNVNVKTPNVSDAVDKAKDAASGMVSGAVSSAQSTARGAMDAATGAVNGAIGAATDAADSVAGAVTGAVGAASGAISSVAGAIAEVAVSFTGAIEDLVLEPHMQLDANASWGDTKFEKGPIRVRVEVTAEEAAGGSETVRVFSSSGNFDEKKKVSEFIDSNEKTVVLLFEKAPMNEKYSLEVKAANGKLKKIFSEIEYGDLRKSGAVTV